MKKVGLLFALCALMLSFTSCYDFSREQNLKDAENNGKMVLAEAENSRKAAIETAKAEKESASIQAQTKIDLANATANEIKIIGNAIRENKEYLEYLKAEGIKNMKEGDRIYIPTEAGLPITERR